MPYRTDCELCDSSTWPFLLKVTAEPKKKNNTNEKSPHTYKFSQWGRGWGYLLPAIRDFTREEESERDEWIRVLMVYETLKLCEMTKIALIWFCCSLGLD